MHGAGAAGAGHGQGLPLPRLLRQLEQVLPRSSHLHLVARLLLTESRCGLVLCSLWEPGTTTRQPCLAVASEIAREQVAVAVGTPLGVYQ